MEYFLLFIILLVILHYSNEGYLNYQEISFKGAEKNCPQIHANNYNKLVSRDKLVDFFGDYSNVSSELQTEGELQIPSQSTKVSAYQMIQPFGYTPNELFDMTRFIETDIPMPTDPDFFKNL